MATIQKFEDLEVWKKARILSAKVYPLTFKKPIASDFRMKDQMRGSVGQLWIILLKDLREAVSLNS